MDIINTILKLISELFIPVSYFVAGSKSKDNERLRTENEKLEKYDEIESGEHSSNDAYIASLWK
jgi:hypothetical protein